MLFQIACFRFSIEKPGTGFFHGFIKIVNFYLFLSVIFEIRTNVVISLAFLSNIWYDLF